MSFSFPAESSFKTLARALEPLELQGRLRYLPSFECCSSCAGARLSDEDWGGFELYATFNEQTKEFAEISDELSLSAYSFGAEYSEEEDQRVGGIVAAALIAGGFEEVPAPSEHRDRALLDPDFKQNSFYRTAQGMIVVRGFFEGKAKPTRAVRELKLKR